MIGIPNDVYTIHIGSNTQNIVAFSRQKSRKKNHFHSENSAQQGLYTSMIRKFMESLNESKVWWNFFFRLQWMQFTDIFASPLILNAIKILYRLHRWTTIIEVRKILPVRNFSVWFHEMPFFWHANNWSAIKILPFLSDNFWSLFYLFFSRLNCSTFDRSKCDWIIIWCSVCCVDAVASLVLSCPRRL